jgi:hypothetical protein
MAPARQQRGGCGFGAVEAHSATAAAQQQKLEQDDKINIPPPLTPLIILPPSRRIENIAMSLRQLPADPPASDQKYHNKPTRQSADAKNCPKPGISLPDPWSAASASALQGRPLTPAWAGSMQGGKGPSSLMTAPSATSITHLSKLIESCKVVGARLSVALLWSCGKMATSKRRTQARATHRESYVDAKGRVVRPQHAMLWPQSIISSSLFTCSGARIKDDVFQLWLNFNSYASPTHPWYVQDYCDLTGPGYKVTVIIVTVKIGSQ